MDACNALTASREGVGRGHVNGAAIIAYLVPERVGRRLHVHRRRGHPVADRIGLRLASDVF
jgi:hypothetical protein